MTKSQTELREKALEKLAEIGGRLRGEEDIEFKGTKFILPANTSLSEGIDFLTQRRNDEENDFSWTRTYPYRPLDGARATKLAIEEFAGFSVGQTIYTFFGRELPQFVDIATGPGPNDREQVPQGSLKIPGLKGLVVHLGANRDPELGMVFTIGATGPRKWRWHVQGLFDLIDKHLREHSIYRGKAIDGGENFLDVSTLDPRDVVFTESVQRRLEGDLWCFMRHEKLLSKLGHGGKFAVLLSGEYGVGKSLAALLTAQEAVAHGWTFLMSRPGKDQLAQTLELARMYQPAVVFAEDVDTMAGAQSGATIERYLDLLDGIKTKGLKLVAVFTTNHAEDIHQGMLRPGRIGAVITIGPMDRDGIERLGRRVIGEALQPDTDWAKVAEHIDGYTPAFVREVFDRSVRYAITLNNGVLGPIGTEALCLAADSLRDQHELMAGAKEDIRTTDLATALSNVIVDAVDGVEVQDYDGDRMYQLAAPGNGH